MTHFTLEDAIVIEVTGEDSTRYLQSRLTNDMKQLGVGECCFAAALTAQGKCQALFQVIKKWENHFIVTCDGGDREEIVKTLGQFVVADRVEIVEKSDELALVHTVDESGDLPNALVTLVRNRIGSPGADLVVSKDDLGSFTEGEGLTAEEYTLARTKAGIPSFPIDVKEGSFYPEADHLISAVARNKGCYVGQEAVEMVFSRGKLPAVLRPVEISGKTDPSENKDLISSVYDEASDTTYGFSRVRE